MPSLINAFRNLFNPTRHLPVGMYHYISPPDDPRNYHLHLRLESDGHGILLINGTTILHLNETAAEYAYYLVNNQPDDLVARKMASRYHVSLDQARQDYRDFNDRIQTLINTPDLDPVTFLDFDRHQPLTGDISAPYRLDCAITYNLPVTESPGAAPTDRVKRELSTDEWYTILDKAWKWGIPHVVFTGGEPTLREDLPDLIAHASHNGQVTGLMCDGLRLADQSYLDLLLQTGLDHLMILYEPDQPLSQQALQNALGVDLFVAVHLTITLLKQSKIPGMIDELANRGVKAISLTIHDPTLGNTLLAARQQVAANKLELVWNLPVPYSDQHPIALETAQGVHLEGAGRAWLYIEPDGDVLPTQGVNRVLGNLLTDPVEKIWKPV